MSQYRQLTTKSNPKRKFTVLLNRPDYLANEFGKDTYLAYVEARDIELAQEMAQLQASNADCQSDAEREDANPEDYAVLAVFEGHHEDLKTC